MGGRARERAGAASANDEGRRAGWRDGLVLGVLPNRWGSRAGAQASVAVNISPLSEAAAKIGSTIRMTLRMVFLLCCIGELSSHLQRNYFG